MAELEYQAELIKAATEQQFSAAAGLSTPALADYSSYTAPPPRLLSDAQMQTFLADGCLLLSPTLPRSYSIGKSKPVKEIISTFHWRFVES